MTPYVQLLGRAEVHLEKENIRFLPDKRFFLLAYLAYRADWVRREHLAFLFWPDTTTKAARKNLRHLLGRARSLDFVELETEHEQVRWLVPTDLNEFQEKIKQENWQAALEKYQGSLLKGLACDLPEYSNWLSQERETLEKKYRNAVLKQSEYYEHEGNYQEASTLLNKILKEDNLAESIMQAYLRIAKKNGQREDALKSYQTFKDQLYKELELEPLAITQQLADDLKGREPKNENSAQLSKSATQKAQPKKLKLDTPIRKKTEPKTYNLPSQLTSFVGRDIEQNEIAGFLKSPNLRLLTLIGPGGIGKTRLALEVAQTQERDYKDGVCFVPLASLNSTDNLAPTIANALKLSFSDKTSPEEQLKSYLQEKNMLLVLDNLEHVIKSAGIILELLEHCPNLKILTTSREALDFYGEWLYEVSGLSTPQSETDENIKDHEAVQLFIRSARRADPHFQLSKDNQAYIARICNMLYGSPLAIELATNWIRLLNVQEVEEEIQKSLDFLVVTHPDLPKRHRSMRAVFEHSWKLLSSDEQTALKNIAVFRGGFRKEAAQAVSDVSLRTLLTLTNKSLLQRTSEGRFERHVMVQEFSLEKLKEDEKLEENQRENHGSYYFEFLTQRPMGSANDQRYLIEIGDELANIRTAWEWAGENKRADQLEKSTDLVVFYDRKARLKEGAKFFQQVLGLLDESEKGNHAALAKANVDAAWLLFRLSAHEQASALSEQAIALLGEQKDNSILMKALNIAGVVKMASGQKDDARPYFKKALRIAEFHKDTKAVANYLWNLGALEKGSGNYQKAKSFNKRALKILNEDEDRFGSIAVLNNMGDLSLLTQDFEEAKIYLTQGLQDAYDVDYNIIIPYFLSNLGRVALALRDFKLAESYCAEVMALAENMVDLKVKATVLSTRGRALVKLNQDDLAKRYLHESLDLAWKHKELPIVMENLLGIAELNIQDEQFQIAHRLLQVVNQHASAALWVKKAAEELLALTDEELEASAFQIESDAEFEQFVSSLTSLQPQLV